MTDAQAWTLIIGSLTVCFGLVGVVTSSFTRVLRAEIGSVRHEISGVHAGLMGEIGRVRSDLSGEIGRVRSDLSGEIGRVRSDLSGDIGRVHSELSGEIGSLRTEMRSGFKRVDERIDLLDRDVQALTRHVFRQE